MNDRLSATLTEQRWLDKRPIDTAILYQSEHYTNNGLCVRLVFAILFYAVLGSSAPPETAWNKSACEFSFRSNVSLYILGALPKWRISWLRPPMHVMGPWVEVMSSEGVRLVEKMLWWTWCGMNEDSWLTDCCSCRSTTTCWAARGRRRRDTEPGSKHAHVVVLPLRLLDESVDDQLVRLHPG